MRSIDQRNKIAEELNLDTISQVLSYGILVTTVWPELDILYANNQFVKMLGYNDFDDMQVSLNGKGKNFIIAEDLGRINEYCHKRKGDDHTFTLEFHCFKKDGDIISVHKQSKHVFLSSGIEAVISSYVDVTDMEKEKHELVRSERLLRQAIKDADLFSWDYSFVEERLSNENSILRDAGLIEKHYNLPETHIGDGYLAPESIEPYREMFRQMRAGAPTVSDEFWFHRNLDANDRRCVKISYTVDFDQNGKPVSASGLALDITEARNIEIVHQKQIEAMMNTYPDALGSFKMNLTQNYISDQTKLCPFVSLQDDDFVTIEQYIESMKENMLEDDYQQYKDSFSRESLMNAFANGLQQVTLKHRFKFTDKMRWINTTARILPNPVTKMVEAYIFAVDITERALNEEMIQRLINSRYDVIALIYPDEHGIEFKHLINEFTGFVEDGVYDYEENRRTVARIFSVDQFDQYMRYTELSNIKKKLEATGYYTFSMPCVLNGKRLYKRYSYNYLTDNHEIIIVTVQDITAAMAKEGAQLKKIQSALKEAEKANASKTTFLSNMSHDIRTPMNAIINMTQMVRENIDDTEKALEDLDKIETSSAFLLSLINDVLDMAKIDSGRMEFQPSVYHYADFLNYVESVFKPLCKDKGINFVWEKGTTSYPIYVDVLRFNQMFFNLLSNAVKYTEPGGTVTYATTNNTVKDGILACDYVVSDTGRGMSKEFQKKMFNPFEREENNMDCEQGTGLGLPIVKSTVDMLGGTIKVESDLGKGTTFTIHLEIPIATEEQLEANKKNEIGSQDVVLEGKRILVAEDHPINREIVVRLLQKRGMTIDMAVDGVECVDMFASHEANYYDAILMDIRMPNMDGLAATKKIRKLKREDAKDVPIIAMTANAFAQDRTMAKDAGMSAYLAKPVNAEELYHTLAVEIGR